MEEKTNWKHAYQVLRTDYIGMLNRVADEMRFLRKVNSELAPKAEAYDTLRQVLDMAPQRSRGMAEDLVSMMDRRREDLVAERDREKGKPENPEKIEA